MSQADRKATMGPRRKFRDLLCWGGLAVTVLLAVAWVVSVYRGVRWVGSTWTAGVGEGAVWAYGDGVAHNIDVVLFGYGYELWVGQPGERKYGLSLPRITIDPPRRTWADGRHHVFVHDVRAYSWSVAVPFWLPFAVCAGPTAYLWWRRGRRIPPGHCRNCGYNLTGNVSGRCSECGTPVPAGQ